MASSPSPAPCAACSRKAPAEAHDYYKPNCRFNAIAHGSLNALLRRGESPRAIQPASFKTPPCHPNLFPSAKSSACTGPRWEKPVGRSASSWASANAPSISTSATPAASWGSTTAAPPSPRRSSTACCRRSFPELHRTHELLRALARQALLGAGGHRIDQHGVGQPYPRHQPSRLLPGLAVHDDLVAVAGQRLGRPGLQVGIKRLAQRAAQRVAGLGIGR